MHLTKTADLGVGEMCNKFALHLDNGGHIRLFDKRDYLMDVLTLSSIEHSPSLATMLNSE